MQVEGQHEVSLLTLMATGARVRNAYRTYLLHRDSLAKVRLIPDMVCMLHDVQMKDLSVRDGDASD